MSRTDITLEALAARLAAGETIDATAIPTELCTRPEYARLLALSRVLHQLDANLASDPGDHRSKAARTADHLGPFRLVRMLGSGGMGEVWLGERIDGAVEQRVAIKRVRGGNLRFAERLREERRLLARLEHPNIARFVDAGIDAAGTPWFALEYVDGVPISDWCRDRRLGLAERVRLFIKVCGAVEHAHRHLIVHRDLKPSNVLVNADGEPKLLDFGIAKLVDGSVAEATQTALTPAYAAPEQLRGGAISTATDVYALGLLLFRLIAGALPETRTGENLAQVLARLDDEETERPSRRAAQHAQALPYPAQALAGDLDAIVAQALRADPARRYGSAAALADDLTRHLHAHPVLARTPTRWYRAGRFLRRHRVAVAFAGVAVVALVAGTLVALDQARRATQAAARADAEAAATRAALARAERGQRFLADLFASASPETNQGRMPTARDLIADGERRLLSNDLPDADRAELAITVAESWLSLGEPAAARRVVEAAGPLVDPANHRDLARIAILRARMATADGEMDVAAAQFVRARTHATQAGAAAAAELASAEVGLGQVALYAGDYSKAFEHATHGHARRAAHFGADHPATIDAGVALAVALIANGRLDDAIERLTATQRDADRVLGDPNAISCRALASLSDALERRGDYQRAAGVGTTAADVCSRVFGSRHSLYGQAELNAAFALGRLGRFEDALARYQSARQAFAATGHFDEGSALRYAAGALMALERWREAAGLLEQAEAVLTRHLGADSELVLAARFNRATVAIELGLVAEAARLAEAAFDEARTRLGPENSTFRNGLIVLASVRKAQGRLDESVALLERLIAAEQQVNEGRSAAAALARVRLARVLAARDRREDGARSLALLDEAIPVLAQPGGSPLSVVGALLDRAELLEPSDPEAARADRIAARHAAAQVPTLPPSMQRRLTRARA